MQYGEDMSNKKKKFSFSPSMMVIKWIAGLIVGSIAVTGVGFVDSVIWKIAIFIASTVATTLVGALYSSQIIRNKYAGGEVLKFLIFTFMLYIAYLGINLVAQFAGTMPLWAFIVIFIIFAIIVVSLGLYVYIKQQEKALVLYYTERDEAAEEEKRKKLEEEEARNKRLGKNKTIDLTKQNDTQTFTLSEIWEKHGVKGEVLKINSIRKSVEYVTIKAGMDEEGKFYGTTKFSNCDAAVNGEIFFSDKPIWFI